MKPQIDVAFGWELRQDPKAYLILRPFDTYDPGFDCSALQLCAIRVMCEQAGIPWLFPEWVSNTVDMYKYAKQKGWLASVSKGVATRGAIMLKGRWWGYGRIGHTSMSCGDGTQFAARNASLGIARSDLYGGESYQDSIIFPLDLVHYAALDPPVDPAVLAWLQMLLQWEHTFSEPATADGLHGPLNLKMTNSRVTTLNNLLILRGLMGRDNKSNTYTKWTRKAVYRLKQGRKLSSRDGKRFGPDAAHALLNPK